MQKTLYNRDFCIYLSYLCKKGEVNDEIFTEMEIRKSYLEWLHQVKVKVYFGFLRLFPFQRYS